MPVIRNLWTLEGHRLKMNEHLPSLLNPRHRFTYRGAFGTYVVLVGARADPREGMSDRRLLFVHSDSSGVAIAISLPKHEPCAVLGQVEYGMWLGMKRNMGDLVDRHLVALGRPPEGTCTADLEKP